MNISEKIRKHRQEKGMTIAELAVKVRIGRGSMKAIEDNKRSPDVQTLLMISTALDIPASEFLELDFSQKKQKKESTNNGSERKKHEEALAKASALIYFY
ncbi:helix-turn-helix domain-containing protein [Alkalihalobacillus sp. R86527]|uniref:helix-turn-helix domain-containing protein n=1 Tax=Alkalihalobacillus sp. R86527 TaxID=3093863 RepID=UPI00366DEA8F